MTFNDRTNSFDAEDIAKNKVICALAYFGVLFFLPLVACPDSQYGKFHANQGLLLLITYLIIGVLINIAGWIPIIGWLIRLVLGLVVPVMFLFGLINTLNGKAIELPFIGAIQLIK